MQDSLKVDTGEVSEGAAISYVEGELGGPVTEKESTLSLVADTVTKVVGNNPERVGLTIVNVGANYAALALSDSAGSAYGIRISANGGFFNINIKDDQMLPTREFFANSPGAATTLYILEVYRYTLTYIGG